MPDQYRHQTTGHNVTIPPPGSAYGIEVSGQIVGANTSAKAMAELGYAPYVEPPPKPPPEPTAEEVAAELAAREVAAAREPDKLEARIAAMEKRLEAAGIK